MNSDLTVIVPVHNSSETIRQVFEPLQQELETGDRLIAVNDRSTDNTLDVLQSIGVQYLESSGKPGAAGTRNTGGFAADTSWILFVDSDAVVPHGWRRMLAAKMQGADAVQGVYSRNAAGSSAATFYKNYYYFHTFTRRIKGPYIKGCGTFFFAVKTDLFKKLEGFDENIAGATIEDADFSERLWSFQGRIAIAPEIEVYHLREYTTCEFFRYEWNMMRAKALYILRRDRSRGAPSISVAGFREMLPVISGSVFSWVFIIGLLLIPFFRPIGVYLSVFGLLFTAIGQIPFKYYAVRDGGFRGVLACFFILPDLLLILPAVVSALFSFAGGKKY